jgi:hypothetical protein
MMASIPGSPVYLDPAHTDFTPGVTELRWKPMSGCRLVFIVFFMGFLLLLSINTIRDMITAYQLDQALRREGIAHQGEIVHCIPDRSKNPGIEVAYFYLIEGQRYTQSTRLFDDTCILHDAGAQVNLHYARSNPAIARLDGQSSGSGNDVAVYVTVIMIVSAVGGVISIYEYFNGRSGFSALRAHGQVLDGELTSIKDEFQGSGGYRKRYLIVRYKLMSPTGKLLEGYQQTSDSDLVARRNLFSPGTPVKVLYADDKTFLML